MAARSTIADYALIGARLTKEDLERQLGTLQAEFPALFQETPIVRRRYRKRRANTAAATTVDETVTVAKPRRKKRISAATRK